MQKSTYEISLAYNINWPTEPNAWNDETYFISIFNTMEFFKIDSKNIYTSLLQMANFIRLRKVVKNKAIDVPKL